MRFWPFFGKGKLSNKSKKAKKAFLDAPQEKTRATADSGGHEKVQDHSHTMPTMNGKRRRTEQSTKVSDPRPSTPEKQLVGEDQTARAGGRSDKGLDQPVSKDGAYQPKSTSKPSPGHDHGATAQTPTLHPRRRHDEPSVLRRKSSKRKSEAQARAGELRPTSSPMPIPKRRISHSEGLMRRDSKTAAGRPSRHAASHHSVVSLPVPESLSDVGQMSNPKTFTIKVLDALSPRPTIRYSSNPRHSFSPNTATSRSVAQHGIGGDKEGEWSGKKKIDDLANDLDAQALRELMDRDQRRRERRRQSDRLELEQKLKQRARYQDEQEARSGPLHASEERREASGSADGGWPARRPSRPQVAGSRLDAGVDDGHAPDSQPLTPPSLRPARSFQTRPSHTSLSPPTSPIQPTIDRASTSHLVPESAQETRPDLAHQGEADGRQSEQNSGQLGSWASVFRRRSSWRKSRQFEHDRNPSADRAHSFRNSLPAARRSPHPSQTSVLSASKTFRRSGTLHRTQSRFIEDLPEFPLSPPDSRVQSPEAGAAPATVLAGAGHEAAGSTPTTSSGGARSEGKCPVDVGDRSRLDEPSTPSVAVLSRSLASVDSEASWLSGKAAKRSSTHRDSHRQSPASMQAHLSGVDADEEFNFANDPYFSRLSPSLEDRRKSSTKSALRRASSTVLNLDAGSLSETEAAGSSSSSPPTKSVEQWHSGVGCRPTLIRPGSQAQSRQAVLKDDGTEGGATVKTWLEGESPNLEDSELQASATPVLRAHSVNYGSGHARRISAGSARLLDIRSSSVDSKRLSKPRPERYSFPGPGLPPEEE